MIDYLSVIKVLDELMLELIDKGVVIPRHISEDLRSGRSLAGVYALQTGDCDDAAPKVAVLLESIEMNLLSLAEGHGGRTFAEEWQRRIISAYANEYAEPRQNRRARVKPKLPSFVSGVPKGDYWVRIESSELAPIGGELDELLAGSELTAQKQDDGFILLYGSKENVSSFLKVVRQKVGKRMKNE